MWLNASWLHTATRSLRCTTRRSVARPSTCCTRLRYSMLPAQPGCSQTSKSLRTRSCRTLMTSFTRPQTTTSISFSRRSHQAASLRSSSCYCWCTRSRLSSTSCTTQTTLCGPSRTKFQSKTSTPTSTCSRRSSLTPSSERRSSARSVLTCSVSASAASTS